ncbi:MAG: aa3-type cytochrome c oxidase subunit IV [Sphingobium sp.]
MASETNVKNIKSAEQTYSSFLNFMKWGTIVSVGLAALVVILIST